MSSTTTPTSSLEVEKVKQQLDEALKTAKNGGELDKLVGQIVVRYDLGNGRYSLMSYYSRLPTAKEPTPERPFTREDIYMRETFDKTSESILELLPAVAQVTRSAKVVEAELAESKSKATELANTAATLRTALEKQKKLVGSAKQDDKLLEDQKARNKTLENKVDALKKEKAKLEAKIQEWGNPISAEEDLREIKEKLAAARQDVINAQASYAAAAEEATKRTEELNDTKKQLDEVRRMKGFTTRLVPATVADIAKADKAKGRLLLRIADIQDKGVSEPMITMLEKSFEAATFAGHEVTLAFEKFMNRVLLPSLTEESPERFKNALSEWMGVFPSGFALGDALAEKKFLRLLSLSGVGNATVVLSKMRDLAKSTSASLGVLFGWARGKFTSAFKKAKGAVVWAKGKVTPTKSRSYNVFAGLWNILLVGTRSAVRKGWGPGEKKAWYSYPFRAVKTAAYTVGLNFLGLFIGGFTWFTDGITTQSELIAERKGNGVPLGKLTADKRKSKRAVKSAAKTSELVAPGVVADEAGKVTDSVATTEDEAEEEQEPKSDSEDEDEF